MAERMSTDGKAGLHNEEVDLRSSARSFRKQNGQVLNTSFLNTLENSVQGDPPRSYFNENDATA